MAFEIPGQLHSGVAASSLAASQFLAVVTDAAGKIRVNTTAGAAILGVLQDKPVAGQSGQIMSTGATKWVAGAAIPFIDGGTPVMSDNAGRCVPWTTGNEICGYLSPQSVAPTGAGQYATVELIKGGKA